MSRRTLVIYICVFILLFFGVFVLTSQKGFKINQAIELNGPSSPFAAYGSNSILFNNGYHFTAFNYITGGQTDLNPTTSTGEFSIISSIATTPNSNYILFHSNEAPSNNPTYGNATITQQTIPYGYWWIYNISKQTFSLLPQNTIVAEFRDNNSVVCLASSTGSQETLTTFNNSDLQQTSAITIPASGSFYPMSSGDILQSTGNTVSYTQNGTVTSQLATSTTVVGTDNALNEVIGVFNQGSVFTLESINVQSGSVTTIAHNINGTPVWSNNGTVLYESGAVFYQYNMVTKKYTEWRLTGSANTLGNKNSSTTASVLVGNNTAILEYNGNYYLTGNNLATNAGSVL